MGFIPVKTTKNIFIQYLFAAQVNLVYMTHPHCDFEVWRKVQKIHSQHILTAYRKLHWSIEIVLVDSEELGNPTCTLRSWNYYLTHISENCKNSEERMTNSIRYRIHLFGTICRNMCYHYSIMECPHFAKTLKGATLIIIYISISSN